MRPWFRRSWPPVVIVALAATVFVLVWKSDRDARRAGLPGYKAANYAEIEPDLWLGGQVQQPPPGVRAVLNLCESKDPYEAEVHRWESIPDREPAPSLEWLKLQVDFVAEHRRAGRPVYVHCAAGISRSAMVLTAYLMWRDGVSRDTALETLRAKRSWARPNPAFMELLLAWEKDLKMLMP